ncbi:MAG: hypothetical protein ACRDKX_09075 [Solirubrobacterales bacterium]
MTSTIHSPFVLFRFAVREGDWALAALIARALSGSARGRRRLERELELSRGSDDPAPSLSALRIVGRLLRVFGRDETPG